MAKKLTGVYVDPSHGRCVRTVEMSGGKLCMFGVYGTEERKPTGETWSALVNVDPDNSRFLYVTFQDRYETECVHFALWCPEAREIHWQDGTVWQKVYSTFDAR